MARGWLARRAAAERMNRPGREFLEAAEREFKPWGWSIYPEVQFRAPCRAMPYIADFVAVVAGGSRPGRRLAPEEVRVIELDGRAHHDGPAARKRDGRRDETMRRTYGLETWRTPSAPCIDHSIDAVRRFSRHCAIA